MKKFFASPLTIAIIALLVAFLLYPRKAGSDGDKEVITFWVPGSASDAEKIVVELFEQKYPQYDVQIGTATVRDAAGDPTRFLLGVAGDVPPDLIHFDRFAIVEWAGRGAFSKLDSYIEQDRDLPGGINPKNYVKPAWNECVYKGSVYAIPNRVDTRGFYYNKDALIRAGYYYRRDDPLVKAGKVKAWDAKPPVTWEQLCRKRLDARAQVNSDGTVTIVGNKASLSKAKAGEGDVVAIISSQITGRVFRARIKKIIDEKSFVLDFDRELPNGLAEVPDIFTGKSQIKIFDRESYIVKLTKFDSVTGVIKKAGFIPFFGNSWLYMYGWLNGGKFMQKDGEKCTLDDPKIVEALQYVTDMYDSLGGIEKAMVFQNSNPTSMLDMFLEGRVAMKIDGNWFLGTISVFKPNMNFGLCPAPIPEARLKAGKKSIGWLGGWAYAIPSTAKKKDAAWKLLRWMNSLEANKITAQFQASLARSKGQAYLPRLHPDIRYTNYLRKEYIDDSPAISNNIKKAYGVFAVLLPVSKYRPVTPIGQKLWNEQVRSAENAIGHLMTPKESLTYGTRQVQIMLDRIMNPPTGPEVPWKIIILLYGLIILGFICALVIRQTRRKYVTCYQKREWYGGYICALPWILGFFTFGAGPIIFSIIISFSHYDVLNPARFIGFDNYINLFHDPIFWISLKNTLYFTISVPISLVAGLALAIFLNNNLKGMQFYRTLFYLPAIVPAVAAFILWMKILDPNIGLINQALRTLGMTDPPTWLTSPVWAKPALILMGLWGVGGSMIIWLAGLKNIPESLYEAASLDGANRWQSFCHVTLPMISPYIFFNLVMGMIGVFQVFEQAYIMTNGGPQDSTLFYAYKLFNEAFRYLNMGAASAMAWILFVVVLVITGFNFWAGKKWVYYE
jgi:multiple sugar transport system permease protein/multiple sugar transport system substrate-binding protein